MKTSTHNLFFLLSMILSLFVHLTILISLPGLSIPKGGHQGYTEILFLGEERPRPLRIAEQERRGIHPQALLKKGEKLNLREIWKQIQRAYVELPAISPEPAPELSLDIESPENIPSETLGSINLQEVDIPEEVPLFESAGTKVDMPPLEEGPLTIKTWEIKGPAAQRKLLYRPRPPRLELPSSMEIELKFWVLPDGSVGQVIPVKRGNALLEREMMVYLKKWRFNPLPPYLPQEKQWGTIPIKYLIK